MTKAQEFYQRHRSVLEHRGMPGMALARDEVPVAQSSAEKNALIKQQKTKWKEWRRGKQKSINRQLAQLLFRKFKVYQSGKLQQKNAITDIKNKYRQGKVKQELQQPIVHAAPLQLSAPQHPQIPMLGAHRALLTSGRPPQQHADMALLMGAQQHDIVPDVVTARIVHPQSFLTTKEMVPQLQGPGEHKLLPVGYHAAAQRPVALLQKKVSRRLLPQHTLDQSPMPPKSLAKPAMKALPPAPMSKKTATRRALMPPRVRGLLPSPQ